MALTNEEILNAVAEKTVLELVELISAFEEKFNVSAAAVAVAAVDVLRKMNAFFYEHRHIYVLATSDR